MSEIVALEIGIDTGNSVKTLGNLEKELKAVKKEQIELNEINQEFKANLQKLEQTYRDLPIAAFSAQKKLKKQINGLKDAIQDNNLALKDFTIKKQDQAQMIKSLKTVNKNFDRNLKSITGVIVGLGEMTASFVLLAGGNKDAAKNIQKTLGALLALEGGAKTILNLNKVLKQNKIASKLSVFWTKAMATAQAAYNLIVGAGSKAMKIFRLALASTGIGLLVIGLVALIMNFDKVIAAVKSFGDMVYKFFKPQIDLVIDALQWLGVIASDEAEAQYSAAQKTIKASEDRRKEIDKLSKKNKEVNEKIIAGLDFEIRKRKALGLTTTEVELEKLETLIFVAKQEKKLQREKLLALIAEVKQRILVGDLTKEQLEEFKKQAKEIGDTARESNKAQKLAEQDLAIFKIEVRQKEKEDRIKAAADRKKTTDKTVANEIKSEEKITKNLEKEAIKRAKILADEFKLEDEQWELLQELTNTVYEQELHLLTKQYEDKYALALGNAELTKVLEEQQALDVAEINKRFKDEKDEADKAAADKIIEDKKIARQQDLDDMSARLDNAAAFLGSLQVLNDVASGKSEAQQRKAFERNKKIQSAQAMISAAKGVVNILGQLTLIPEPFSSIYKGVQIAILAATLGAQLKKINSAKFEGGGSSIQTPSLGGGGGTSAPTLNPISNTNTLLGQDNKVYVTETDISTTQNKVKVIEERATF